MQIKVYTESRVYGFNIDSTSISENKIILKGIEHKLIIEKSKHIIFEDSEGIPNMNIKNIRINGVTYDVDSFDKLKKLLRIC